MVRTSAAFVLLSFLLAGCSTMSSQKQSAKTFASGEKATIGPLTYNVIDTEIATVLADGDTTRTPQQRFVLIHITASSSSNADVPIPAMTLVDDSGKNWPELADGTGVADWLGVVRKVGPGQTESGHVIFDAPAQHYRLRLTDPNDDNDVGIDIPLDFVHEQLRDTSSVPGAPAADGTGIPQTK